MLSTKVSIFLSPLDAERYQVSFHLIHFHLASDALYADLHFCFFVSMKNNSIFYK